MQINQPKNIIQFSTVLNEDHTHSIYALDVDGILWLKRNSSTQVNDWVPLNRPVR